MSKLGPFLETIRNCKSNDVESLMEPEHISVMFILKIFDTQSFFVVSVAMYVLDSFSERMVLNPVTNYIMNRKNVLTFH